MHVKENRKGLEISGTHQLLVYVNYVNLLAEEIFMYEYYKEKQSNSIRTQVMRLD